MMRNKKSNAFIFNAKNVITEILIIMEDIKRNSQAPNVNDTCIEVTQRHDLYSMSRIKSSRVRESLSNENPYSKLNKIEKRGKIKVAYFQEIICYWAQVTCPEKQR